MNPLTAIREYRHRRRLAHLQSKGMQIGRDVWLPDSVWLDQDCAFIQIGDYCAFGEFCALLTHDGTMDRYLGTGAVGRIIVDDYSMIGMNTTILMGSRIGPYTLVGACSLVKGTLEPFSVYAGNPIKRICSLEDYIAKRESQATEGRGVRTWAEYRGLLASGGSRQSLIERVLESDAPFFTGSVNPKWRENLAAERKRLGMSVGWERLSETEKAAVVKLIDGHAMSGEENEALGALHDRTREDDGSRAHLPGPPDDET